MFSKEPVRTILIPVALAAFVAAAQAFIAGADTRAIIIAVLGALVIAAQEFARSLVTPTAKVARQSVRRRVGNSNPAGNPDVGEPRAGGRPGGRQGGYADSGLLLVLLVIFVVIALGGFFASKLLWLLLLVVLLVALLG